MQSAMREAVTLALFPAQAAASAVALKQAAERIPIGKKVKVSMLSGKTIKGKLRAADDTGVRIEYWEDTRYWDHTSQSELKTTVIRYDTMQSIERDQMGTGTKVAIIAGTAVVVLLILASSVAYFQS